MGDHFELQITPETPGRPSIRNPFESPNDYHRLHETLVPSPSVFKSKPSITTPAKFKWSIDEMASLLPVHIDQEDIQRQSLYLSQSRTDSDIEEKCQNAIDQFFTKEAIVPSPWAAPSTRKTTQSHKKSTFSPLIIEESQKLSVACQTTLSLPVTFDLEKILGEYYRCEEVCEAVQESLSSSSLRRKLFLDGVDNYMGSDNSSPPSPERGHGKEMEGVVGGSERSQGDAVSSPMSCGVAAPTPSTGQFSSSPIQEGRIRNYSLGSIASPLFPDRSSPAGFTSPTLSPIGPEATRTPIGSEERKHLSFQTPDGVPLDMDVKSCTKSPYVEGCSPIRSCSPHQLHFHTQHKANPKPRTRVRCWASPPLISPILNPKLQDSQEPEEQLLSMELGPSFPSPCPKPPANAEPHPCSDRLREGGDLGFLEPVKMEQGKEAGMGGRLEDIVEGEEDEPGGLSGLLTSSRMGNVSAAETSHMFVSMLTEGSSIRYDCSMQVDSGYNTTSAGTASLIDGFSSDVNGKESFSSNVAFKGLYPYH